MKAKIIAVINQKGGVGKSSICVNLAYELCKRQKKILLIDIDPQGHTSSIYSHDVNNNRTIAEAFIDKGINLQTLTTAATIHGKPLSGLDIIPSTIKLASSIDRINGALYREKILSSHLKAVRDKYHYIIIDCPPTLGILAINAIYAAHTILIPTIYGRYSLDGMADLLEVAKEIKEEQSYKYLILRNLFEKRNIQTNKYVQSQLNHLQKHLLSTVIRKNEAINQAQISLMPVQMFDKSSSGVEDFELLAQEVESRV